MANLAETSTYEAGIFQIETSTEVLGGPDGVSNTQAKQLANRTKYLKDHVDALEANVSGTATQTWVNDQLAKLDAKASVRVATTASMSLSGLSIIDGVDVLAGDRVLAKNQSNGAQNGIYVAAAGGWSRASDADATIEELTPGAEVTVEEGVTQKDTRWRLNTDGPIILGTSVLVFEDVNKGYAPLASPAFTNVPTAPTAARGTNTTQLATQESLVREVGSMAGAVMHFATSVAPTGWLKANGAAVSRTAYAALFAVVGTTFGAGDGSSTFNLPDLRGQFLRSFDDGRGLDSGRAIGTAQSGQNASHTHGVTDPTHAHSVYDPTHAHSGWTDAQGHHSHTLANNGWSGGANNAAGTPGTTDVGSAAGQTTDGAGSHTHNVGTYGVGTGIAIYGAATGISIQAAGGNETRPTNVALLACIKF